MTNALYHTDVYTLDGHDPEVSNVIGVNVSHFVGASLINKINPEKVCTLQHSICIFDSILIYNTDFHL